MPNDDGTMFKELELRKQQKLLGCIEIATCR